MAKLNLSEAAKEILDANLAAKRGQSGLDKPQVGASKLQGSTAYGTKEAGVIGRSPDDADDILPDYLKGTPRATPPGATPPVGQQSDGVGASKPKGQPQETMGRSDLMVRQKGDQTSYEDLRDRKKYSAPPQTFEKMSASANFQSYGEEVEEDEDLEEIEESKQAKKQALEEKMKERMKEDIDALLSGENLSEEFATKATTIFEAAVLARSEEVIAEAEADLTEQFESALDAIKEDLASKVDAYLNYMVEQWMEENQVAIEKGLHAEIVEDFIGGLRDLFIEHSIDIPKEKVDVVEELATKVNELEDSLSEEIKHNVQLKQELNEQRKIETIYTACEGLTQTQVEKMKSHAEGVEFTTGEEFATKLETLKESYFKSDVKVADASALDEIVQIDEEKKVTYADSSIEQYAKTISKTVLK